MHIGNNLLSYLKKSYLTELLEFYDEKEAEQLLTILIEHFFNISRYELILKPNFRLTESEILKLHMAVKQLKDYKPVQYITGVVEFNDIILNVNSDVLIPRPETEELVQIIKNNENKSNLLGIDIGTGSGCIAISLSVSLNKPIIHALDISQPAIDVAKNNAVENNQEIKFHHKSILDSQLQIKDENGEKILFDFIVSNPPYVTQADKKEMKSNVLEYEPHGALFVSDNDPIIYYNAIINFADSQLKTGGRIYFEINEKLGKQVTTLLKIHNYMSIQLKEDINGRERFIYGIKP